MSARGGRDFRVGSAVWWLDNATHAERSYVRHGTIIAEVPAGEHPLDVVRALNAADIDTFDCGPFPRDEVSFVVRAAGRLWWPQTRALNPSRSAGAAAGCAS